MNQKILNQLQKIAGNNSISSLVSEELRTVEPKERFENYYMDEKSIPDWNVEQQKFIESHLASGYLYTFDNGVSYYCGLDIENFVFIQSLRCFGEYFILRGFYEDYPDESFF